jgi:uncharacterized membrane protein
MWTLLRTTPVDAPIRVSAPTVLHEALMAQQLFATVATPIVVTAALALILRGRPRNSSLLVAALFAVNVEPIIMGFSRG